MVNDYSTLLNEYEEFLPSKITSINDVSAVLGAVSVIDDSLRTSVPVETILLSNNSLQKEAVGDSSKQLCIVEFETVDDKESKQLECVGVRSRPVVETDIVDYPYYKKSQGASKSLTQRSNDKVPEKFFKLNNRGGILYRVFGGWCELSSDMDSRPWWIDELQEIGESAEVEYPDYPTVKQATPYQEMEQLVRDELFSDSDDSFDGFVSIEIDGKNPSELEDYQRVMEYIVKDNIVKINGHHSVGECVGLVSNTVGEVSGVSDTMFTDYTSSKQLEEQPYLSGDESWRHRPIRVKTAQFIDIGTQILEDLYAYLSFGDNQYSLEYYVIPTLYGSYSYDDVVEWYQMVEKIRKKHSGSSNVLKAGVGLIDDEDEELDLLGENTSGFVADGVFISLQESGNKNKELLCDVMFTDRVEKITELLNSVSEVVGGRYSLSQSEYDTLFTTDISGSMLAGTVFNPQWIAEQLCGTEYSVPSSTSIEHKVSQAFLFDTKISYNNLLELFVERLMYIETDIDSLVNKGTGYYNFVETIGQQQLVLQSLDRLELILEQQAQDTESFYTMNTLAIDMTDSNTNIQGDAEIPFYLGRIVGGLSYTQQSKYNVSSTAFSQYSINYVSKQNFSKVYQEVVDKVLQYTNKSGNTNKLEEYTQMKKLSDALKKNPNDWNITENEFKYYYALGVTDGFTYTEN